MAAPLSFAEKASLQFLQLAGNFEKRSERSPLVRELAERIKTQNWMAQRTEVVFTNWDETITLEFSEKAEVVKYERTGGKQTVHYDHRTPTNSPLARYTWTTVAPSKNPSKKPGWISEENLELARQLAPWALTAALIEIVGKSHLALAVGLNIGANQWTEGTVPVTPKIFVTTAAITSLTPNFLLMPALLYGGWKAAPRLFDKIKEAAQEVTLEDVGGKVQEIRRQLFKHTQTAVQVGADALSAFASFANIALTAQN